MSLISDSPQTQQPLCEPDGRAVVGCGLAGLPGQCDDHNRGCESSAYSPRRGELPLAVNRALVFRERPDMDLCAVVASVRLGQVGGVVKVDNQIVGLGQKVRRGHGEPYGARGNDLANLGDQGGCRGGACRNRQTRIACGAGTLLIGIAAILVKLFS